MAGPTSSQVDNFDGNNVNANLWGITGSAQVAVTQGQLRISNAVSATTYGIITSNTTMNLTSSNCFVQIIDAGNQSLASWQAEFIVKLDANNSLIWYVNAGFIHAQKQVANVYTDVLGTTAYNSAVHKWFRIREAGGTIFWDFSTNGIEWTNYTSLANPFAVTALNVVIQAGTYNAEASGTTAIFDNLNFIPGASYFPVRIPNKMVGPMALRQLFRQPYLPPRQPSQIYIQSLTAALDFQKEVYKKAVLGDSPQLYWRLNENGSTTAADTSGNGNTGTYTNPTGYTQNQAGALATESDTATTFIRANAGYVTTAGALSGQTAARSFEAWIKSSDYNVTFANNMGIMGDQNNANTQQGWYFYVYSFGFIFGAYSTAGTPGFRSATAAGQPSVNVWHHVVGTWDGLKTLTIYLDGVQVGQFVDSTNITPNASPTAFNAAKSVVGGGNYFNGGQDEIAVYTKELTAARVWAHFQAGSNVFFKKTNKGVTASQSFAGSTQKSPSHGLSGVLSFTGNVLVKRASKVLSGVLDFVGAVTRRNNKPLTSVLDFVGNLTSFSKKNLTGVLSFTGSIAKSIAHGLTASLSFTGNLLRRLSRTLSASLGFSGNLNQRISRSFTATLTFTGNLAKAIYHVFLASLGFTGTTIRSIQHGLSGSLGFSGNLSKRTSHLLGATLSFTGNMVRTISHLASGALSFVGNLNKRTSRTLTGTLGFTGNLSRLASHYLTASLSFTGSLLRSVGHSLQATLNFVGSLSRAVRHNLSASLSFIGALTKGVYQRLTATLDFVGAFSRIGVITRALTATLDFTGAMRGTASKSLNATLDFSAQIMRSISHYLTATLGFVGSLALLSRRYLSATLSFSGAFQQLIARQFQASLNFTGQLNKTLSRSLAATLNFAGQFTRLVRKRLTATLGFFGSLFTNIIPVFHRASRYVLIRIKRLRPVFTIQRKRIVFSIQRPAPIKVITRKTRKISVKTEPTVLKIKLEPYIIKIRLTGKDD